MANYRFWPTAAIRWTRTLDPDRPVTRCRFTATARSYWRGVSRGSSMFAVPAPSFGHLRGL